MGKNLNFNLSEVDMSDLLREIDKRAENAGWSVFYVNKESAYHNEIKELAYKSVEPETTEIEAEIEEINNETTIN